MNLTEMKDADRASFLDSHLHHLPIRPSGKGFREHYTEAQKVSQAMRHFLPKLCFGPQQESAACCLLARLQTNAVLTVKQITAQKVLFCIYFAMYTI